MAARGGKGPGRIIARMKVLDLRCAQGHGFEGWFGSEDEFRGQLARGLVECPFCGDTGVEKLLSAPRLNLGAPAPAPVAQEQAKPAVEKQEMISMPGNASELHAAWLKMARQVMANTVDVGPRFAEEARRIHYGEAEERGIRGQASREETEALLEEGIGVMPFPMPKAAKETLQ